MPTYYLHLRDGHDDLLDEEGHVFPTVGDLTRGVLRTARDIIAADVLKGVVNFAQRIDAEDSDGAVVHSLEFRDAVTVAGL